MSNSPFPEKFSDETSQACDVAEGLIEQVFLSAKSSYPKSQITLLEVYAGPQSPLVEAVRSLGFKAMRFTKADGDLSTLSGRRKLWEIIDRFQPENIWVAPECRPWGGWARLNQFKSVKLFDQISQDQQEQLQHVKLCASLSDFQSSRGRHFHLEQPLGSRMPELLEFQKIRDHTQVVHIDMCAFGLKIPGTQKFLKKSSQVFSSCPSIVSDLYGSRCPKNHEHQTIEGSISVQGQRMQLTQFCASYCQGFARRVAKSMCQRVASALVNEHEDSPPLKKVRFSHGSQKKFPSNPEASEDLATGSTGKPDESMPELPEAVDPNPASGLFPLEPVAVNPEPSPSTERWREAFRLADLAAPRVGNVKVSPESTLIGIIQSLVPEIQITEVFVCRGTERFQLPISLKDSAQAPIRHTVCLHRNHNTIHDLGSENWFELRRLQRIRHSLPSKLCITSFGHRFVPDKSSLEQVQPAASDPLPEVKPVVPLTSKDLSPSRPIGSSDVCEGWGPPPIPLHGPNFRNLTSVEKADLIKLHKNLGHPDPKVLSEHLVAQKAPQHIVEAAKDFVCDACVESTGRRHQRPAKLHESRDFNDCVGIDGFFWRGHTGFQVHVLHCIDEASLFHLGKRIPTRNPDQVISSWNEFWTLWAGSPRILYADPAGEFRSQTWKDFLQSCNIQFDLTTEAWQRGRVERHGGIIKEMLNRYDQDRPIQSVDEFDQVLIACFQAKNALSRHQGYSPEQIVLGKSTHLPASLTSDENVGAHSLADGDTPESEQFRRHLDIRSQARKTFLVVDNNQAIRRALLRRTCPMRGPYEVGHFVMYWVRNPKVSRLGGGRWHGPAKVVCVESPSALWISHADRLFKVAPESIRPASLREWNQMTAIQQPPSDLHALMQPADRSELISPPPAEVAFPEDLEAPGNSPEYSPTPPSVTPQSTMQPEIEATPAIDIPVPDTPIHTPALEPTVAPESHDDTELPLLEEDEALISTSSVLSCFHVQHSDDSMDPLLEISTFESGLEENSILIAEDDLPFVSDPIICHEEQCFMLEVPMSEHDFQSWWISDKPEAFAQVASASKRARAEVQLKTLTLEDRILFEKAKDAELNCWIQTSALRPILRKHLNPSQILKSRWVLTWKPIDDPIPNQPTRKAKARLVVLGFQDPQLTEVARDSPTLTREGRHTILQSIASHEWILSSFDIKTAFLRGKADSKNPLAMEPPIELRKKLNLNSDQVCSLVGNAYGRVDAPLLFYQELTRQLKRLSFQVHPLEPCIFQLVSLHEGHRTLHGIIGVHVDDGICGGDEYFHQQLDQLKNVLPFGSFKQRRFVFTGIQLEQHPDFSVSCSQAEYVRNIPAIEIGRSRRNQPESSITEDELSKLRGLIGSLQYAVTNTRPDMAAKLGEVQTQVGRATINTLLLANKVLREAQSESAVKVCFRHIPVAEVTHVSFGDASFASPKQLDSFQGTLICATDSHLNKNEQAPISPLTWSSKKIARVVRSTLSAEAFSMSRSVDKLGWLRLLWGSLNINDFNWREPPKGFQQLPKATIVTDCKSLFDLVTRTAMPSCEEYRTTLEVLLLRERCQEHCYFRWIPTNLQLADPLTKPMDPSLLRIALASGVFQLFDEDSSLQSNAHRKAALSWLRAKGMSHQ